MVEIFDDLGVSDFYNVSVGISGTGMVRTNYAAHMSATYAAAAAKKGTDHTPVFAVQRIITPDEAEGILERGEADAITLVRALIADPGMGEQGEGRQARDDPPLYGQQPVLPREPDDGRADQLRAEPGRRPRGRARPRDDDPRREGEEGRRGRRRPRRPRGGLGRGRPRARRDAAGEGPGARRQDPPGPEAPGAPGAVGLRRLARRRGRAPRREGAARGRRRPPTRCSRSRPTRSSSPREAAPRSRAAATSTRSPSRAASRAGCTTTRPR